ncbi:MAG: endolytic transglycosylase MltG [Candidatus Paceibacterota bacterium]|jgi:UPF0755 protein
MRGVDGKGGMRRVFGILSLAVLFSIVTLGIIFSFPGIVAWHLQQEEQQALSAMSTQFPVTVDPQNKIIVENTTVNTFLESTTSPFQAAAINAQNVLWGIFEWITSTLTTASWYQNIAAAGGRVVIITPGMRKEQVANTFAKALAWNSTQAKNFTTAAASSTLPLSEGSFSPGTYLVDVGTTPTEAQMLVNKRFSEEILDHYGTSTAEIVPLDQALTIASLIQREAGGPDDMRIISGIIWNRLFINMNLQIDATLQYAKANSKSVTSWWPRVVPADAFRKSPYNTYKNKGLPPTPIANPSVAAVLAALNPKNTDCLFYFHDNAGQFHCTNTYAEHVALLKKYFGRGK